MVACFPHWVQEWGWSHCHVKYWKINLMNLDHFILFADCPEWSCNQQKENKLNGLIIFSEQPVHLRLPGCVIAWYQLKLKAMGMQGMGCDTERRSVGTTLPGVLWATVPATTTILATCGCFLNLSSWSPLNIWDLSYCSFKGGSHGMKAISRFKA